MSELAELSNLTVVLVSDNGTIRKLLRETLIISGLKRIYSGDSGAETVKVITSLLADVVILDWDLEARSVESFLAALRSRPSTNRLAPPIVALQSKPTRGSAALAAESGVRCILMKPLVPHDLWSRLHWLTRHRRHQTFSTPLTFDIDVVSPARA